MKNYLNFLVNSRTKFDNYAVLTKTVKRKSYGDKLEYEAVVSTLIATRRKEKFVLFDLDSGRDDWNWGALGSMLLMSKDALADFKHYQWKDIKKPFVDYWIRKQEAEVAEQKRKGAQTIWTPAGDYTLGITQEYISRILLAKYLTLKDRSIIDELQKNITGFEGDFNSAVLNPLKAYIDIEDLVATKKDGDDTASRIVDYIISPSINNSGERLLDPDYNDDTPFLTEEEEVELGALWKIYEEEEKKITDNKKLSNIQKQIQKQEFWRSPQGKRLNTLNAGRVRGGRLSFEEKEQKKKKRVHIIISQLEELLTSWGISYDDTKKGVAYYQYLYEKELAKRWEQEKHFNTIISRSKKELEFFSEAYEGKWNSDNLTLFGVIISIALSVGFGIGTIVPCYKIITGFVSSIASILLSIFAIKNQFTRKQILYWMTFILK